MGSWPPALDVAERRSRSRHVSPRKPVALEALAGAAMVPARCPDNHKVTWCRCEVAGREYEYVALNQDTTESDLKARRELEGDRVVWVDQAATRAAVNGRVACIAFPCVLLSTAAGAYFRGH